MDAVPEEMPVERGKLCQLPSGLWYVHCRWCEKEARFQARNLEEAYGMLDEWRQYWDEWQADCSDELRLYWSCPACREY